MKMLNRILLLVLVIGMLDGPVLGQEKRALKYKTLSKRKFKLNKSVPVLLDEAERMMNTDPEGALGRVEEALALSITQKSVFNEANCYRQLGRINEVIGDWELALENYELAYEKLNPAYRQTTEFQQVLDGLVNAQTQLGQDDKALQYLQLKSRTLSQPQQQARNDLQIADNYYRQNRLEEASQSIQKAEETVELESNPALKGQAQAIKSKILIQEGDIGQAEQLYQESQWVEGEESFAEMAEEPLDESKEELIKAYQDQDLIEEEINLRTQSILSNKQKKKPLKVVQEKQKLGQRLIETGNTSVAIRELEEAVQLADSLNNVGELANTYRALAEVWETKGNAQRSLSYYRLYAQSIDRLKNEDLIKKQQKEKIIRKQKDIVSLSNELALDESEYNLNRVSSELQSNRIQLQQFVIYALVFLLLITAVGAWLIYRSAMKSKVRGQLLALKSLRSQMNPHFIFNALNSVNQFIALNNERAANKFLSEFSKLMRLVLDNSKLDFITLSEEKEIVTLYLKLEHKRFSDKFDYDLIIDEELPLDSMEVPPMLIQPYIENAIWHGLRYKEVKGRLTVRMEYDDDRLIVDITDDGIGRKKSSDLKTKHQKKHQSTGLKNTEERIAIINKVYQKKYEVSVSDLNADGSGTHVRLILPQNGKH